MKKGKAKHPLYQTWIDMRRRCYNPKRIEFNNYGGRGISVCDNWRLDFWAFARDMGEKPTPFHTLDRIDNNKGYSPANCRWATNKQQMRNTSRKLELTYNGTTKPLAYWAEVTGVKHQTLRSRIKRGWTAERALTLPIRTDTKSKAPKNQ